MNANSSVVIENLVKRFGDFVAVDHISLETRRGEIFGFLGPNGAGKSTTIRMLCGLLTPTSGRALVAGYDVAREAESVRQNIGYMSQKFSLYNDLKVIENLRLFAKLYRLPDAERAAREWLERTGLDRVRDGLVREFSRGMRQRLAVARAFLHNPSVLLLDEPFTALDDRAVAVLQNVLRGALSAGCTVIMSTHQLREAMELATHVALINRGRIAFHGERTEEMVSDPGWVYSQYGES